MAPSVASALVGTTDVGAVPAHPATMSTSNQVSNHHRYRLKLLDIEAIEPISGLSSVDKKTSSKIIPPTP
jgi:hypothetical protein